MRGFAQHSPDTMGNEQSVIDTLLTFEPHWEGSDIAFALVIAAIVTAARKSLMYVWTDFAIATDRSNKQVGILYSKHILSEIMLHVMILCCSIIRVIHNKLWDIDGQFEVGC